jgi:trigger factor
MSVELGSGQLIPGFEDQLVGAKAGDTREVKVSFPGDYPAANLAGKKATFDVTVKAVKVSAESVIDEEFAKSLGLQSLEQLRGLIRDQQAQDLNGLTRTHMKRQLLDQLAERHDFAVPESMLEAEYQNILNQLRHEASHEADPKAALAEIEQDAAEYRKIAERRVRLGLLLSDIGAANGVEVSEQEMNRLIGQAAAQYQGKDRENFLRYVQQEPMAAAQLRAPLYEDKVVDFLFSKAEINERTATREELEADLESEEGHVHGPGCGHDHAAPAAKAAKGKKSAAKAGKAEPAPQPEKPAKGPVENATAKAKPAKPLKDGAAAKAPATPKAAPKPAKAEDKPAKAEAKPAKAAAKPAAKKAPAKKK